MTEYKSREKLPVRKTDSQRNRNGLETHRLILEKTAEALSDTPFHALTITDVAKRMNMSKGTFYNYFPSLEAVLSELAMEFPYLLEEKLSNVLALASCITRMYVDDTHWAEAARREIYAVLGAFEDFCVAQGSVLSAIASLAVGRGNVFSDTLTAVRDILVRVLLEIAHYGSPTYPDYLMDAEASEFLVFYLLPMGASQKEVTSTMSRRVLEVAVEWRGKEDSE